MSSFLQRWDVLLCLALQMIFLTWPQLDTAVTGFFYQEGVGFYLSNNPLVQFSYHTFAHLHFYVLPALVLALIWFVFRSGKPRPVVYLLVVLIIGPGLVVNEIFKAESGRARPAHTELFGGDKTFSPALTNSDQCEKNCSFVSGHAAMGFYLLAFAWVFKQRRWLLMGIVLGALVGFGRVVQGAHFFSDVVFSFWLVYFTALIFAKWFFGSTQIRQPLAK